MVALPPRPNVLAVNLEGIPAALQNLDRWVVWRYDLTKDRKDWAKVPYRTTGRRARANDERTWSTFDQAVKAYTTGRWDGIGIALGDGLVGVDLDESGPLGQLAPWASAIIATPSTYVETSPSGTGIKAYALAVLQGGADTGACQTEGGKIEIYAGCSTAEPRPASCPPWPERTSPMGKWEAQHRAYARWFAVTGHGNGLDLAADTALVQRAVDTLVAARSAKGQATKDARTIATATSRIITAPNGTRHNATKDAGRALAGVLLARGIDPATVTDTIAELGEHIGLPRDEADSVGQWVSATVSPDAPLPPLPAPLVTPAPVPAPPAAPRPAQAGTQQAPTYTALVHASKLSQVIPSIEWLIPGVLAYNSLAQLFGAGGSGKSLLALDQALTIAQRLPVVYVAAEAPGEQADRIRAWCDLHGRDEGHLFFWPAPVALADLTAVEAFIDQVLTVNPALIVIDPLAACMVGLEESSTGDMSRAIDALNRIRAATGAAINVVHHTGWSDQHERGSSALRAACRIVTKLSTDDNGLMTLTSEKANNGPAFEARYFRLVERAGSVTPVPASKVMTNAADRPLSTKQLEVLEALNLRQHADGATFTTILDATSVAKSSLNNSINRLLELGYIWREKRLYTISDTGRAVLQAAEQMTEIGSSVSSSEYEPGSNWIVNWERTNTELARPDAEFGQFAPIPENDALVRCQIEQPSSQQFGSDTASECHSSYQFGVSSVSSSVSEFASSVSVPPLRGHTERTERTELTEPASSSPEEPELHEQAHTSDGPEPPILQLPPDFLLVEDEPDKVWLTGPDVGRYFPSRAEAVAYAWEAAQYRAAAD